VRGCRDIGSAIAEWNRKECRARELVVDAGVELKSLGWARGKNQHVKLRSASALRVQPELNDGSLAAASPISSAASSALCLGGQADRESMEYYR